jgi:hypothetical protein
MTEVSLAGVTAVHSTRDRSVTSWCHRSTQYMCQWCQQLVSPQHTATGPRVSPATAGTLQEKAIHLMLPLLPQQHTANLSLAAVDSTR